MQPETPALKFLITGIVFCHAQNSGEVHAAIAAFFKTHDIKAANLVTLPESSQHRVMFDVALIEHPSLMADLKDAITSVYPHRSHITVAMVTNDQDRIPALLDYWLAGGAAKPDPALHIQHAYLRQ